MEYITFHPFQHNISRIGLGTWSIGGSMWGGTTESDAIETIQRALSIGINLIDSAPVYGFGKAEEFVGKAIKKTGKRDKLILATKAGLQWGDKGEVFRDSRKKKIFDEVERSLKRLETDYIDIYQIHWPDPLTPISETAEALQTLKNQGKIRAAGVSNYSIDQIEEFQEVCSIDTVQPPFNIFEKEIENNVLEYCLSNKIIVLGYGPLCRGLLTGKMEIDTHFADDDIRKIDPKFRPPRYEEYLKCVGLLNDWAKNKYNKNVATLALRWVLDKGVHIALMGARKPQQLNLIESVWGWKLTEDDMREIDQILVETIPDSVGPEFMAPPSRRMKE